MNIVVTGGAGFIGSRLVRALTLKHPSARIHVLDNLHPQVHGENAAPPDFPDCVTFVHGDVANQADLDRLIAEAQPDLLYHLAAETGTGQSHDELVRYSDVNVTGTARLLQAIREHGGGRLRRLVLAASRAVYGEGLYVDADGNEVVAQPRTPEAMAAGRFDIYSTTDPQVKLQPAASRAGISVAPSSVYASTKLMQEYLVCQGGASADWSATILRFQNVYGPGQSLRNPYTGVLSIFSQQQLSGKQLNIYEDGEISRDFVFVDDVVSALVAAGERSIPHGEVIDIGSGLATTILRVANTLIELYQRPSDSFHVSGDFRIGDIRHAKADIDRARRLLNWTPQVTIEQGLELLAAWCKQEYADLQR